MEGDRVFQFPLLANSEAQKMAMRSLVSLAILSVMAVIASAEEPERLVGGHFASTGEIPYQVSLRIGGSHICGGTLISRTHVLTAAHCVYEIAYYPYTDFKVYTGTTNVYGGTVNDVKNVVYHEAYQNSAESSWVNDIALITLKNPITENSLQRHIPLASSEPRPYSTGLVSGWGRTSAKGPISQVLKKSVMTILDAKQCRERYNSYYIYDSQICGFQGTGVGVCSGDSGGPFVVGGELVGIVSWVIPCAVGFPDTYTNVYRYINWIKAAQASNP